MSELPHIFDAHLHPHAMRAQDLESMRFFGVTRALALPHVGPERTAAAILESLRTLLEDDLPRLERAGIQAVAAVGIHPRALPRRGLTEVMSTLPELFQKGKVVALGETGFDLGNADEEEALLEHLSLAKRLKVPVLLHTPRADKDRLTRRLLSIVRESGVRPGRVLVDHAGPRTVKPILECGHYAGLTLHPDELSAERAVTLIRKLGPERIVLNSDAGARAGDILGLARAAGLLKKAKLSASVIQQVVEENALEFLRR